MKKPWTALCALLLAAASLPAAADAFRVKLNDLPPGLSVELLIQRTECQKGAVVPREVDASRTLMAERASTVFERVVLPGGQVQMRPRVISTYEALVSVAPSPSTLLCSAAAVAGDFRVKGAVLGADSAGQPAGLPFALGDFIATGSEHVMERGFSARTTLMLNLFAIPFTELRRGVPADVALNLRTDVGGFAEPRVSLSLPVKGSLFGLFHTVAQLSLIDGKGCITAQGSTRCKGAGPLLHGGVLLDSAFMTIGFHPDRTPDRQARWRFTLQSDFPAGDYRVIGGARFSGLDSYLVDGLPTVMNLLPWQSDVRTVPVF